ncbi:MAG: hypothetical protein A3A28_02575 [Candidatus Sungbacteria bacterium RIFCSPLOWO2_01_FULL_47_32]|uniref:Outer membrane lipoprotein BamD-like domain-containing protein n=1 Tax=Candidatus Sungbacteria bacterium RIFCSPHIGHO2_01_FULL_47_32 TaxID=1802264 RepID=A0A1G2K6X1_9BACT|nr:MAG: hypothetical protein UX72_C0001G0002 [Parcubacteria group bacterium GW2011_GWA2_47_10]OGZ94230.1 MAG: hypothetical protein A2633_05445 [Candidatus Sungbacteria bacterium RIFCSPHIGHO2_01_FULL_47_32]OHA05871.1 MAG: hypothetical protein A3A28_02575 [Candidatus Sungbacteria bacterium RIFCSPLOWO2_01_FULL_47_32]
MLKAPVFRLLLGTVLMVFVLSFLGVTSYVYYEPPKDEYTEYEELVYEMLSPQGDSSVPDYRDLYLKKIAKYEAFIKKYPKSPLVSEAKLRIAELYRDVDRAEIYTYRKEMFDCVTRANFDVATEEFCIADFYRRSGNPRDPLYFAKAQKLLEEIVRDYGHNQRYALTDPGQGRFEYINEDAGGYALYLLSQGKSPEEKLKNYRKILKEYRVRPEFKKVVEDYVRNYGK